jgi:alpha-glucosidase
MVRVLAIALLICSGATPSGAQVVASPSEQVRARFMLEDGRPQYTLSYRGNEVIAPSTLGIDFANAPALDGPFEIADTERRAVDSSWTPVVGARHVVPNYYNVLTVTLRETEVPHRLLEVTFRAYDEGVGLRYRLPAKDALSEGFTITAEQTRYRFGEDARAYSVDRPQAIYGKTRPLDALGSVSEMPFTVETGDSLWVSLMEARLVNYSRTRLVETGSSDGQVSGELMDPVTVRPPFATPWRVFLLACEPGTLLEHSYLVRNFNPPNALDNVSWIEPGAALRVAAPLTTERAKNHVALV